jgi:branched-chain amino acid transport system substrate-binding protein
MIGTGSRLGDAMRFKIPFSTQLLAALSCSAFISCAATMPVKKEPAKASAQAAQELRAAEANLKAGQNKKALAQLKKVANANPNTDVADDAHLLMGNLFYNQKNYAEAIKHYETITSAEVASPLENEARIRTARSYVQLQKLDEAGKVLENSNRWNNVTENQKLEIAKLKVEVLTSQKKTLGALQAAVELSNTHPNPTEREKLRAQAQEIFDSSRLSGDELKEIGSSSDYGFLQPVAKYRYALMLADQKDYSRARRELSDVASLVPGTELGERAQRFVQQIDARNRVDARTVGVVLPLSGPQAAIGYKALRGIQMGLGLYGSEKPSGFKLAVVDSEGNVDGARRGIERLVQEDNVVAIIGGLMSKTATVEAARAQEFGVPTIMLSQKAGVTEAGESIFRNALTSQMQVQALVDLAMKDLGYKNFALMYPNDAYGTEYANLFWDAVKARGGDITGAQVYDPKETDFRAHVQRLTGTFYMEDRSEEFRYRSRQYAEKNPKRSARQGGPSIEDILPPVVDFDAIFIPDEARAVGQIAPALAYNNVRGIRLLGTNIWNSPRFLQRGQKFVENAIFVDSVLTNDPSFMNSNFYQTFKATFNDDPGLIEVQGYDSALMLRQVIASGESTRIGVREKLASLQNFPGALGSLSVTPDREIRRPMTALTVSGGKFQPLDSVQRKD